MKIKNWNRIKTGTILIITWSDIKSENSWLKDDDAKNYAPATCKDVGWFVNDDELNIRLTSSIADDGDKNIVVIPKGTIRDVKKISMR